MKMMTVTKRMRKLLYIQQNCMLKRSKYLIYFFFLWETWRSMAWQELLIWSVIVVLSFTYVVRFLLLLVGFCSRLLREWIEFLRMKIINIKGWWQGVRWWRLAHTHTNTHSNPFKLAVWKNCYLCGVCQVNCILCEYQSQASKNINKIKDAFFDINFVESKVEFWQKGRIRLRWWWWR